VKEADYDRYDEANDVEDYEEGETIKFVVPLRVVYAFVL
jgi:hypothetical protein